MNQVELIRARAVRGFEAELLRFKSFVSMTEGNAPAVDALKGEEGRPVNEKLTAKLVDVVLAHIGHTAKRGADDPESQTRRVVKRGKV